MRFWRSKTYLNFFHHLDQQGGFFYERWGDAPVHSIAASLFLSTSQIHQWNDLGYYHSPFVHCPTNVPQYHANGQCFCDPADNFDLQPYSCTPRWWKISGSVLFSRFHASTLFSNVLLGQGAKAILALQPNPDRCFHTTRVNPNA